MSILRRHRWLASLLFALSPGLLGQALPVLHPCAVEMPWMVMGQDDAMADMAIPATDRSVPAGDQQQHAPMQCTCIGCSATATIPLAPTTTIAIVAVEAPAHGPWPILEAAHPLAPAVDLLPPSTAPPLA